MAERGWAGPVAATLNYCSPTSGRNRRYVAPGAHLTTTVYDPHQVVIGDGRAAVDDLRLDAAGFALVSHDPGPIDLDDDAAVTRRYVPAACELVRALTGADLVVSSGWVRRRAGTDPGGAQPPADDVHVDVHPDRAPGRFAAAYAEAAPDGPPLQRTVFTSLWRCYSPPPQDWPLAVCDYRSVQDDEGVANLLLQVPALPAEVPDELDRPDTLPAASVFTYRAAHRWWYFPDLARTEAVLVKLHDSDHGVAWRAPHSAFRHPTVAAAWPRQSIELRTMAFFTAPAADVRGRRAERDGRGARGADHRP